MASPEKSAFRPSWNAARRCLIPAEDYDEPYYPEFPGMSTWWRFARADGEPWMLAGLWSEWTDRESGEIVPSYTMLTINCNAHPLLRHMHKPDVDEQNVPLPMHRQDKRTVVPIAREHFETWLHGTPEEAAALIRLPALELFAHGPANPVAQVALSI